MRERKSNSSLRCDVKKRIFFIKWSDEIKNNEIFQKN